MLLIVLDEEPANLFSPDSHQAMIYTNIPFVPLIGMFLAPEILPNIPGSYGQSHLNHTEFIIIIYLTAFSQIEDLLDPRSEARFFGFISTLVFYLREHHSDPAIRADPSNFLPGSILQTLHYFNNLFRVSWLVLIHPHYQHTYRYPRR